MGLSIKAQAVLPVVLQKLVEDRKLLGKEVSYAATNAMTDDKASEIAEKIVLMYDQNIRMV